MMHDDPQYVLREIVPWVITLISDTDSDTGMHYAPDIAHRGAILLDCILQGYSHGSGIDSPLLYRANAYLAVLEYAKAFELAQAHLEQYPGVAEDWAAYICAESLYRLGDFGKATDIARGIIIRAGSLPENRHDHNNTVKDSRSMTKWEGDHYDKAVNLLLRISHDDHVRDERLELFALEKGATGSAYYGVRLMILTKKYCGIDRALGLFTRNTERHYRSHGTDLEAAAYLVESGRIDEAVAIYKMLADIKTMGGDWRKSIEHRLLQLDPHTMVAVSDPVTYSTGAGICAFPSNYTAYCFPVMGIDSNIVRQICHPVEEWFGMRMVIEEPLPFPAGTFDKKTESHDFFEFSRQLLQNANVPDDALFVLFITEACLSSPNAVKNGTKGSPKGANVLLCSTYYRNESNHYGPAGIADHIISLCLRPSLLDPAADDWIGWERKYATCDSAPQCGNLQVCNACAAKYKSNFAACHKALHAFLGRPRKMLATTWQYPFSEDESVKGISWQNPTELQRIRDSAEQGSPIGQYQLASLYRRGLGLVGDEQKAEELYSACLPGLQRLAESGDVEAYCDLGRMYEHGWGVNIDYDEALRIYRIAALRGDCSGQYLLGKMYRYGRGTGRNAATAMEWYLRSAAQGNASAQNDIGTMYENGEGVKQDYDESQKWFRKAAEAGDARGQSNLGVMYENGYGVQQSNEEAIRWYRKSVEQGNAWGLKNLSNMYRLGKIEE